MKAAADSIFERAMVLHRAGAADQAAELYDEVLRQNPQHPGAWHLLGVVHLGRGEHQQALEYIERALSLCDTKAVYFNNYGAVLRELDNIAGAKSAFKREDGSAPIRLASWQAIRICIDMWGMGRLLLLIR